MTTASHSRAQHEAAAYLSICGKPTLSEESGEWVATFDVSPYEHVADELYLEAIFQMACRVASEVTGRRMFPVRVNGWAENAVPGSPKEATRLRARVLRANSLPEIRVTLTVADREMTAECAVGPAGFDA